MTSPAEGKTLYYPVWVSTTGRVSLRWGRPCDTPAEATAAGKVEVRGGRASLIGCHADLR